MTAYLESLRLQATGAGDASSVPSYLRAADTLNTANGNESFLESAADTIASIPKFITVSLISGANQLYNIPADIGNLVFDAGIERSNTEEVITSLDSDLGAFYKEHQEGADLVGFMVSSLVPGLGGIKALKAGQTSLRATINGGKVGGGMSKALGLLAPQKQLHLDKALKAATTNSSAAGLINRNALRAVGSGLGQNALEALAFETAVATTMFNSPILENQDFGDFVTNVAWGASVFGMVGGAIDAVKIRSAVKGAANTASIEARPWTFIDSAHPASSNYEKVALDFHQIKEMPPIPTGLDPERTAFLQAAAETKRNTLELNIRETLGTMAGGDQNVADSLYQTFKRASLEDQMTAFVGMTDATRIGVQAKVVKRQSKLEAKMAKGTATLDEIDEFASNTTLVTHAKAWGEDAGKVMTDKPVITQLVDTLGKGESVIVKGGKVKAGKRSYSFDTKFNVGKKAGQGKPWNILQSDTFATNARYIWASKLEPFNPTAAKPLIVDVHDIPLMEKVLDDVAGTPAMSHVRFTGLRQGEVVPADDFLSYLGKKKVEVANKLLETRGAGVSAKKGLVQEEIAAITNVKSSMLDGMVAKEGVEEFSRKDIMAMQDHAQEYTKKLVAQGSRREAAGNVDIWNVPQHMNLTYDTSTFKQVDNFVLENMAVIKEQQKLYQEGTSRAAASVLGDDIHKFEEITSGRVYSGAVPSGAGAGFATAASSNYGTLAASVENIGRTTTRVIDKFRARTRDTLEPLLGKLAQNQEAAVEWSVLNNRIRSIEGQYALNEAGTALEPLQLVRWRKAAAEATENGQPVPKAPVIPEHMEPLIEIKSELVQKLAKTHIEINGAKTRDLATIRSAQGARFNRPPEAFYPIPVDPRDFPYFATVTDESITSTGHTKTLFASSADELDEMIKKLKTNPQLTIRTKQEAQDYYKAIGQFDYEKTINTNYIDTEALRKGVSAPHFVPTDPNKITTDMLNWHLQRDSGLVREAVSAKYEVQFNELRRLGDEFTGVSSSKFSNRNVVSFAEEAHNNPFADYIKTALGVRKTSDYPWWVEPNKLADAAVSRMFKRVSSVMETSTDPSAIAETNRLLKQAGYRGADYDESMMLFANSQPAKGLLTAAVQKANALIATVVLRWDPLNAVNNAVSANVLLGAETKAIMRAVEKGDEEAAGALAKLTRIAVPGAGGDTIFSASKLIANATAKFNRSGADMAWYKENGFVTTISDQYRSALDSITFNGKESVRAWDSRLNKVHKSLKTAADKGESWTGNRVAEEFNRFVAADVMKQMSDVAVQRGLMTAKEQLAYINTFVNRTQGNYLAAQRPMMFQGPIGQAIGLFQTYQFNLIQQLLRHVGEGHTKDAMTMLALQGTIHGMNGLPAFNAVNTHLVGTASGNTEHRDAYTALYGTVGKEAGDWLMYGVASNALGLIDPDLKVNLYTRGDINPRHLTLVPTNPAEIPFIQAFGKVIGNLWETTGKLAKGGDIKTSILQGLEHNGLSRPLAGLAQTLQRFGNPEEASYSTSKKGNVIAANDLLSLTTLARVVGGKPLDEAIAIDATYRYKAYAAKDTVKRAAIGETLKTTMIAGNDPTQEQVEDFAEQYARAGGRQDQFNKWFTQLYKTANLSQANALQRNLNSPFSKQMQTLMGGQELRDFSQISE